MDDSLDELFAGSGYSQDFVSREFIDNNDNDKTYNLLPITMKITLMLAVTLTVTVTLLVTVSRLR